MKRKLFLTLFVLIMSFGLMACNAEKNDATAEVSSEVVEEGQTGDVVSETVSEAKTEWVMPEPKSVEEVVEESNISWYMDEEGIKNEQIGISIKRDNGVLEKIEFNWEVGIYVPSTNGGTNYNTVFECTYYDGEFEDYISENGMQKDTVNGVEYAYKDEDLMGRIAIGGKGIVICTTIYEDALSEDESYNDYLSKIDFIKSCDNFSLDCIAYFTEDGFYCPPLGISMSCLGTEHSMGRVNLDCATAEYSATIVIGDESIESMMMMDYRDEGNSAQDAIDKYVEDSIQPGGDGLREIVAIDGTAEVKIGKCNYLGRGVVADYEPVDMEWWRFYSDDNTWSIRCDYDQQDGISYENYLAVFELLE